MSKHQSSQKYVLKIDTNTLKKHNWNLTLSFNDALENENIIALAESTCLRFIDEINGVDTYKQQLEIKSLRERLKVLKSDKNNPNNRNEIKKIYNRINELSFRKDYLCLVANNKDDYRKAVKGFYVNGIKYVRLLSTTGQLKKSTIVFVNEKIHDKLLNKIENGRNKEDKFIPSKYNAYLSLVCSSSTPVSEPKVIVVKDCVVNFHDRYISIKDNPNGNGEPILEEVYGEIQNNINDGFGLISPNQADKWSKELLLDYRFSGCCVRNSFLKGMLFCFDFHDFAKNIANQEYIIDIWGNKKNIFEADIIITESMLKLWNSYSSYEDYYTNCQKNGFKYSVTKVTPKKLDNIRNLNYQYLQSYELSEQDINELIQPTVDNIKDVLGNDVNKAILFLKGYFIKEKSISKLDADFVKALMIDEKMINDPFVQSKLNNMLNKKINDAKMGVLQCHGNFSLISGDPFALCQSMFGLKVTGLLKSNQFYSKYWNDRNIKNVVAFRSPMSCHNNIKVLSLVKNPSVEHWYRYMSEVTIFNGFDCTNQRFNGADYDGDMIFTTDNNVLLRNTKETLPIICSQKKGEKTIINNKKLIDADMRGFGDEIGSITNKITAMFDIQCLFDKNSNEYKTLEYRIMCGQKYQQDAIDKIKGIESLPMPKYWYNQKSVTNDAEFNSKILVNKKPYFFIYNYPELKKEYHKYLEKINQKSHMLFGKKINDLLYSNNKTPEELDFVNWCFKLCPITDNKSTMNNICHKIEKEFEQYKNNLKIKKKYFDYSILKCENVNYNLDIFNQIKELYNDYTLRTQNFKLNNIKETKDRDDFNTARTIFKNEFVEKAYSICNNKYELCNIILDICYKNNSSKQFAWDICGDVFIENLLNKNNRKIKYLECIDDDKSNILFDNLNIIEYNGFKFIERITTIHEEC